MRTFQQLGIVGEIEHELVAGDRYVWYGADGGIILDIPTTQAHPSGWSLSYLFHQPTVEAALDARARREPTVTVERGWVVDGLRQDGDNVTLTMRPAAGDSDARWVRARYVVGCDGANSFVRDAAGIARTDLGFAEPWIVIDARPHDMADFAHLPSAAQHCDPRRPTTAVQNGANFLKQASDRSLNARINFFEHLCLSKKSIDQLLLPLMHRVNQISPSLNLWPQHLLDLVTQTWCAAFLVNDNNEALKLLRFVVRSDVIKRFRHPSHNLDIFRANSHLLDKSKMK